MGSVGCARGKAHQACPQTCSLEDTSEPRTQETRRAERARVPSDLDWRTWAVETQGRALPALPVKRPRAHNFGFAGRVVSVTATQLCGCGIKVAKFNV